jgi:coproporphyrinogen III oxidase-like Fe-S oxidoreductase
VPFGEGPDWRTGAESARYSPANGDRLAAALCREVGLRSAGLRGRSFATVFFSGGPSRLSLDQLYRVLQALYDGLAIVPQEQTMVVDAGAVDAAKAKVLRESGFDRVELRVSGSCPEADFRVLRGSGFSSVGLGLEYDPEPAAWAARLGAALRLEPDHFALGMPADRSSRATAFGLLQAHRAARDRLSEVYTQYVLHHYCLPGHESLHELAAAENRPLVGFGPAAVTRLETGDASNPTRMADYLAAVGSGKALPATEPAAWARLRNSLAGLSGVPAKGLNRQKSRELVARGLLESRDNRLHLTDQGVLALDAVARELAAG